ncbi:hypothetical protein CO116_00605 [Candidatus Falkowbacteria bacterium CG_4_9_14_3_um_filter_38_19]|uniref:50S ribosomal protein L7/L12 n=2 Tax=Candidatus Falkowiibacteriota TaxID=1752728 RepID=A0A2M6WQG4_9BACT|nr:hypothetical protein [Candidatus Parcubacteria bacterium]PIT95045.1 MAG: hypothetical protein COT96_02115 [Candidatus Falkowbacteria bacterium CG10_big_fil_rev_8_21_14_0_10_38_22]PJB17680.1 MAG: hypothetical protein CO116_00605 [Candidatus Falkowbacteria bacterium CG_4_9_14_3_um_filter_38_19]
MINQNKNEERDNEFDLNEDEEKLLDSFKKSDSLTIPKSKVILAKKLLQNIKENNEHLIQLLTDYLSSEEETAIGIGQLADEKFNLSEAATDEGRVIEGVFDGENMIGPDGKQYSMPANYASKSKLVEGDILKLTITSRGTFVYKQIGPIERARIVGKLDRSSSGDYLAMADGKKWKLLTASVTYYKGEIGDEVVILIPKTGESKWAAVENIVRKAE